MMLGARVKSQDRDCDKRKDGLTGHQAVKERKIIRVVDGGGGDCMSANSLCDPSTSERRRETTLSERWGTMPRRQASQ